MSPIFPIDDIRRLDRWEDQCAGFHSLIICPPLGELIAQVAVGQGYLALLVGKCVYGVGSLLHNEA